MERIVLDTSILWDPAVTRRAGLGQGSAILPSIALTERARQVIAAGRDVAELWAVLRANKIVVEDFGIEHGMRRAAKLPQSVWDRHARDALIAGHVGPDDVLWTKNPKDFLKVGLAKEQIVGF